MLSLEQKKILKQQNAIEELKKEKKDICTMVYMKHIVLTS